MIGLYTVDLLAVVMTILTSVGHDLPAKLIQARFIAIATKPIARWQVLGGKWMGVCRNDGDLCGIDVRGGRSQKRTGSEEWSHRIRLPVALLVFLECVSRSDGYIYVWHMVCRRLRMASSFWAFMGWRFLGGWLEQMSGIRRRLAVWWTVGIVSSLVMPSEAVWRRAAFEMESPLEGSLQFSPFADISVTEPQ